MPAVKERYAIIRALSIRCQYIHRKPKAASERVSSKKGCSSYISSAPWRRFRSQRKACSPAGAGLSFFRLLYSKQVAFWEEFAELNAGADFYAADLEGLRGEGAESLRIFLEESERHGIARARAISPPARPGYLPEGKHCSGGARSLAEFVLLGRRPAGGRQ